MVDKEEVMACVRSCLADLMDEGGRGEMVRGRVIWNIVNGIFSENDNSRLQWTKFLWSLYPRHVKGALDFLVEGFGRGMDRIPSEVRDVCDEDVERSGRVILMLEAMERDRASRKEA